MSNPMTALVSRLRCFIARREGNTAIIFGLAAIPVVVAAGMAVDVTRAYMVKERLSAALDAASLAVGSEGNLSSTQMQTELTNYFVANYPSTALGRNVTVTPLNTTNDPNGVNLAATVVNYQAQATVDMSFMSLVGVQSITVTALAQTHRGYGLEVALVLDNTGSMLCGPNDGAPNYTDGSCGGSVDASDTTCSDSAAQNQSRICTLRNASLQFLTTMKNAITASGQLYIGVVPYVTTVNVGPLFCTGNTGFNCQHMTQDTQCSNDFTDDSGNIVAFPNGVLGSVVAGTKNVGGLANNPGSISDASQGMQIRAVDPDGGTTTNPPFPPTTINSINIALKTLQLTANPTGTANPQLLQLGFTGDLTAGSPIIKNINPPMNSATNPWNNPQVFTPLYDPAGSGGAVLTDNQASTSLTPGYTFNNGQSIPINTAVKSVDVKNNQITLCNNATTTVTGATIWTWDAIPFEPTANVPLGNGAGQTTESWMGCVVEPTSGDENSGVSGVINYTGMTDPDTSEPINTLAWYPFWWRSGQGGFNNSVNNWTPKAGSILGQSNTTEVQGNVVTDWDKFSGPNQGCPVPILPLQDATTTAGQTAVQNTINAMWPRDAGGTQVAIGMIWGWRLLSANGPFPQNGGHPLTYSNQAQLAWKKAVILMTDGTEEWPNVNQDTGLGYLSDGKIGTSGNLNTAVSNLGSRLASVCNNMKASGNFVIYTIGLGSDGASNTDLRNCATPDGGFFAATPSNLTTVFQSIANSLLTLRLSQ